MEEEWKPIPRTKGKYEASNFGRLRNVESGRIFIGDRDQLGYRNTTLRLNGNRIRTSAHRLVMEAFVGVCPKGYQVNHIDHNPSNNYLTNLEYVTPSENVRHSFKHGRARRDCENSPGTILTNDQVKVIKERVSLGDKTKEIAKDYKVTKGIINNIKNGKTWQEIPWPENAGPVTRPRFRLRKSDIPEIKQRLIDGETDVEIAQIFRVSSSVINRIRLNKNWKSVPWPNNQLPPQNETFKLNEETALEIFNKIKSGGFMKDIAKEYGIAYSTVKGIKGGYNWSHVTGVECPRKETN